VDDWSAALPEPSADALADAALADEALADDALSAADDCRSDEEEEPEPADTDPADADSADTESAVSDPADTDPEDPDTDPDAEPTSDAEALAPTGWPAVAPLQALEISAATASSAAMRATRDDAIGIGGVPSPRQH